MVFTNHSSLNEIVNCIESLKRMVRSGWMMRGIPASIGENVASHSFEAAFLGLLISIYIKERGIEISPERVATLAILHDFSECKIGDIPLKTSKLLGKLKEELEINEAVELLDNPYITKLFAEYQEQRTLEAKIARLSEKLSTILEARRMMNIGFQRVREILESSEKELVNIIESLNSEEKQVVNEILDLLR